MDEHDKKIAEQLNLDIIITKGIRANMSPTIIARTIQETGYTKNKFDIKQIMDKIDGEIKCANNSSQYSMYKEFGEDTKKREYFEGKEVSLKDLKAWIQENIIKP